MIAPAVLKLFFDGGCRPNPGRMETAVVARGEAYLQADVGHGTSGEAEWRALLHALDVAAALGARDIVLIGDSANVVAQAVGKSKCATYAQDLFAEFRSRAAGFASVRLRAVRRSHNLAGGALKMRRAQARPI